MTQFTGLASISAGIWEDGSDLAWASVHFAVSVTDTGPGIPLDQQDRIFEQFHQVDSSMTKAKGGTGLGSRHRQADRRDARRPHLGRVDAGQRVDVSDGAPHARRIPKAHPGWLGVEVGGTDNGAAAVEACLTKGSYWSPGPRASGLWVEGRVTAAGEHFGISVEIQLAASQAEVGRTHRRIRGNTRWSKRDVLG